MAVEKTVTYSSMSLSFNQGLDEFGKEIIKKRTYSNVKPDATPENIFNVATAIGGLCKYTLEEVGLNERSTLVQIAG